MAWEKFKMTYPDGSFPGGRIDLDELDQFEQMDAKLSYYARDMLTAEEQIIWYADNRVERRFPYNILFNFDMPNDKSCLNVYGVRMVLDSLTNGLIRNPDGTRNYWPTTTNEEAPQEIEEVSKEDD